MQAKSSLFSLFFQLSILFLFFTFKENNPESFIQNSCFHSLLCRQQFLYFSGKSFEKSNTNLFCSYNIISSLFEQFGLTIKHSKSEIFHFSRSIKNFDSPSLDLSSLGESILQPRKNQRYLRFIFNIKLSFQQYICFYSNKVLLTIKSIKILDNSTRGLLLLHKQLLYRMCIIPIVLCLKTQS